MAFGFVQGKGTSATVFASGSATSAAVAYTSNNAAGNLLVCVITTWINPSVGPSSITDTAGNTWSSGNSLAVVGTDGATRTETWWVPNSRAGANTVTVNWAASHFYDVYVAEYSGGSTPTLQVSRTATDSSVTAHSTGATAGSATAGDLVLGAYGDSSGTATITASDGKTLRASVASQNSGAFTELLSATSGTQSAGFTSSTAQSGAMLVLGFLPGTAGVGLDAYRPLLSKVPHKIGPFSRGPAGLRAPAPRMVASPTTILGISTGATPLRAPISDKIAQLHDGSFLAGYYDGSNGVIKWITSPANSPEVQQVTTVSYDELSIYTLAGSGTTDIWIESGSETVASGNNAQNQKIKHGVYNGTSFVWDTETLVPGTISAGRQQPSVTWTGTWLIAAWWDDTLGGNSDQIFLNWTTVKAGTSGWQSTALLMTTTNTSQSQCQLRYSPKLGATVLVYGTAEKLWYRTLKDSAASPALTNWLAETSVDASFDDNEASLAGPCLTIDEATGKLHLARGVTTTSGPVYQGVTYWLGTPDATPMSTGTITWNSRLRVDSDTASLTDPPDVAIGVDGSGQVFLLWVSSVTTGSLRYVTLVSPFTSTSAISTMSTPSPQPRLPHVPAQKALDRGFVPLLYQDKSATPIEVVFDTTLVAAAGAPSFALAGSISGNSSSGASLAEAQGLAGSSAALSVESASLGETLALVAAETTSSVLSATAGLAEAVAGAAGVVSSESATAGEAVALSASSSVASVVSATASEAVVLSAFSASLSTVSGNANFTLALAGRATSSSSTVATASIAEALAAPSSLFSSESGSLSEAVALSASEVGVSVVGGNLQVPTGLQIAGASAAVSGAAGTLSLVEALASSQGATVSLSATASEAVALSAVEVGGSSLSSIASEAVVLSAATAASSSVSGTLQALSGTQLSGTIAALGGLSAAASEKVALQGASASYSDGGETVGQAVALGAASAAASTVGGNASFTQALVGSLVSAGSLKANAVLSLSLVAETDAGSSLSPNLALAVGLASSPRSSSGLAGNLLAPLPLASLVSSAAIARGNPSQSLALLANLAANSSIAGTPNALGLGLQGLITVSSYVLLNTVYRDVTLTLGNPAWRWQTRVASSRWQVGLPDSRWKDKPPGT